MNRYAHRKDHSKSYGSVSFPVSGIAPPSTGWRPHIFRIVELLHTSSQSCLRWYRYDWSATSEPHRLSDLQPQWASRSCFGSCQRVLPARGWLQRLSSSLSSSRRPAATTYMAERIGRVQCAWLQCFFVSALIRCHRFHGCHLF